MRTDLGEIEKEARDRARKSTDAFTAALMEHHGDLYDGPPIRFDPEAPETLPPIPNGMIAYACAMALPPIPPVDYVEQEADRPLMIDDIIRAVCIHFKIKKIELISARRSMTVVRPRQIGYYLAKKLTAKSLPEIGRRFGGRDHTSILSGIRKIEQLRVTDAILGAHVCAIASSLGGDVA